MKDDIRTAWRKEGSLRNKLQMIPREDFPSDLVNEIVFDSINCDTSISILEVLSYSKRLNKDQTNFLLRDYIKGYLIDTKGICLDYFPLMIQLIRHQDLGDQSNNVSLWEQLLLKDINSSEERGIVAVELLKNQILSNEVLEVLYKIKNPIDVGNNSSPEEKIKNLSNFKNYIINNGGLIIGDYWIGYLASNLSSRMFEETGRGLIQFSYRTNTKYVVKIKCKIDVNNQPVLDNRRGGSICYNFPPTLWRCSEIIEGYKYGKRRRIY